MGYYLEIEFDDDVSREEIIERFYKAGAIYSGTSREWISLNHPDIYPAIAITIDGEPYAEIRFPFGAAGEEMYKQVLKLAQDVGGRLYDGQLEMYITFDNLHTVPEKAKEHAKKVMKWLGVIEKKCFWNESSQKEFDRLMQYN